MITGAVKDDAKTFSKNSGIEPPSRQKAASADNQGRWVGEDGRWRQRMLQECHGKTVL